MNRRSKRTLWLLLLLLIAGGAYLARDLLRPGGPAVTYRTTPVTRGDLLATIGATGSLEPEEAIDVGAQVGGQISQFGTQGGKPIDRRSFVKKGELLAQIDPSLYKMDLASAQAQLAQSEAQLAQSNAQLAQGEAQIAQSDASVVKAQADIEQMEGKRAQAEDDWNRAQRNLDYCTITSPVDGVVIDRRVNIGQTVVSSLNAPSLFLIAKDLTRMQIWVSVNEADIGSVHDDQPVTFTVDARPSVTFLGTVTKVRFDATMTQNVVTYPVEVLALNPDGLLYPYMTANVQFELGRRTDVLKAPNAALRYAPLTADQVAPEFRPELDKLAQRSGPPEAPPPTAAGGKSPQAGPQGAAKLHDQGLLWVRQGQLLRPIAVRVGMSDGTMSEVQSPELKDGLSVVVSEEWQTGAPPGGAPSPFVPQLKRR